MWDRVQLRVTGPIGKPTLVYLPGLHGDWTLIRSFSKALGDEVRFVEITYPRTITWSLQEYADAVLAALKEAEIQSGWILGESFGSQIAWQLLKLDPKSEDPSEADQFSVSGIILAGGFVKYPVMWMVPIVQGMNRFVPMQLLKRFCRAYAIYGKIRHRHAPETLSDVAEFVRRRTEEPDRQAIAHRYTLIRQSDFCDLAIAAAIPIYQLTGFVDPIVPWFLVRRWLKRSCPNYAGWRLIWRADHNVLGSAPAASARQILKWINSGAPTAASRPVCLNERR
jgi:pimeloyl-ACP methyl ester carboxylesterase